MAIISRRVSDLTGTEAEESRFVKLVVRRHPAVDEPKVLDVLPEEIAGLDEAGGVVVLEVHDGEKRQLVVPLSRFREICSDDVVARAPGTRGRKPGYRRPS